MNTLTLAIVNDGDTYAERLRIARTVKSRKRVWLWGNLVDRFAGRLERQFGDMHSFAMIMETVTDLEAYYSDHVAEIDRCAAEDAAAVAAQAGGV